MSRKAFSLVEMLIVIMTIPVVMIVVMRMYRTLLDDIPKDNRIINEQLQVDLLLKQLQADFDQATEVMQQTEDEILDANTLVLKSSRQRIIYRREGKRITRSDLNDPHQDGQWDFRYARITWSPQSLSGRTPAVRVECFVPQQQGKRIRDRFARTYLFIAGLEGQL